MSNLRRKESWYDWRFENADSFKESLLVFRDYFKFQISRWYKWKRVAVKLLQKQG